MEVERLTAKDRDIAVHVLATAFHEYPVMRYVLQEHPDYDRALFALIGFYCDKRLRHDWPVLGVRNGTELVAVATVTEPPGLTGDALEELEKRLLEEVGAAACDRMARFEMACDAVEPKEPHHMVGMLGTLPGHQGRGYGKAILDHVKEMSVAAGSEGVALTTEDPVNVPLYEHLGFQVCAEADVDAIHIWSLAWRNDR